MPSKAALTVTTFQNPDGSSVVNGYLLIRLNIAGSVNNEQIQSNYTKILLNSSGVIVGSPTFWPNASISPIGTYYIEKVYNAIGQLIAGPNSITV